MTPQEKRLYRSRTDHVISGVCGGIAKYTGIDTIVVRVIWIVFSLFYLIGLIVYIILWLLVPLEP
ncbi:MAG: PspC domain-containing protein [Candidatus Thorarchaeota archaeon]